MATLPDPTQIRRETPRPSTTVASYRGGITESAQAQFGADVAKMAEVEGNRIDNAVVEEAYTELRQRRAELSVGEKGYASKKGSSIVSPAEGEKPFIDDYTGRFGAAVESIATRLSPRQREKFDALASRESVAFQTDVLSHSMRETEAYNAKAKEGAINFEMQQGTSDPAKAPESLDRINRVYDRMIEEDKLPADGVNALRNATLSKFHQTIVDNAIASGDTAGAKAYFEQNKKQILNAEVVGKEITKAEDAKLDMEVGVGIAEENLKDPSATGDLEAVNRAIRNDPRLKGDVDRIHAAQREAASVFSARRDALNQKDAAVYRMVLDGRPLDQIKRTSEFRSLSIDAQNKIIEKAKGGSDEVTGAKLGTFYKLVNDPKRLAGMTEDEIVIFGRDKNLGNQMTAKLLDMNSQFKNKPEKVIEASVDATDFNHLYRSKVGKDPQSKDEKAKAEAARFYVENRINMAQRQSGQPLNRDDKKVLIMEALQDVETPGAWWGTNKAPLFAVPAEKIAVPAEQRAIIAERLKKHLPKGVEPSELDIQNLYLKEKQLPIGR